MSCLERILVINGAGNTASLVFGMQSTGGAVQLFPFGDATRYTLTFTLADGSEMVIDTDDDPDAITFLGDGEIEFDLGGLSIPAGLYIADLRVFTPTYPTGFLLHSGEAHTAELDVR